MEMKVYCKNCKFRESFKQGWGSTSYRLIIFCLKYSKIENKMVNTPHERKMKYVREYGMDFEKYNGKNDCRFFEQKEIKRKWWKVWVK